MRLYLSFAMVFMVLGFVTSCETVAKKTPPPPKLGKHLPKKKPCNPGKKPVIIAVIDTGYGIDRESFIENGKGRGFTSAWKPKFDAKLCRFGHKDFSLDQEYTEEFDTVNAVPKDLHGHGTHIAGLIDKEAKAANLNYCLVIIKYYNDKDDGYGIANLNGMIKAIEYATRIKADFINMSGGGIVRSEEEIAAVKKFLDQGGTFVAAAGNESVNMDFFHFYPAQDDDRVIVVGNGTDKDHHAKSSNYGDRVNIWENGQNLPMYDMAMSGTSQATAVVTGKLAAKTKNFCK